MNRRSWDAFTLILVALNMGAAFAHVMELPGKMRLAAPDYLKVQGIYRAFGPIGRFLEPGSVLAAALMTLGARRRPAFPLSLVGTTLLGTALGAWLAFVSPMNARMENWLTTSIPQDWTATRDQWEYAHATRFALQAAGFAALLLAALSEAEHTPK
jgi:hypothetical protein